MDEVEKKPYDRQAYAKLLVDMYRVHGIPIHPSLLREAGIVRVELPARLSPLLDKGTSHRGPPKAWGRRRV